MRGEGLILMRLYIGAMRTLRGWKDDLEAGRSICLDHRELQMSNKQEQCCLLWSSPRLILAICSTAPAIFPRFPRGDCDPKEISPVDRIPRHDLARNMSPHRPTSFAQAPG